MSDNVKIKLCPWCGGEAEKPYVSDTRCKDPECPAHYFVTWMPYKVWQQRPLEDALRLARDRAVSMVERLIEAAENLMDEAEVRLIEPSTSEVLIQWNTLVTEAQKEQNDV